jgi:hypothetical protein
MSALQSARRPGYSLSFAEYRYFRRLPQREHPLLSGHFQGAGSRADAMVRPGATALSGRLERVEPDRVRGVPAGLTMGHTSRGQAMDLRELGLE